MKRRWVYFASIVLILTAALIIFFTKRGKIPEFIKTAGIVEGIEVNISTKVPGKISYICCKEGDAVRKGDRVITLEAKDLRASVKQAFAGVEKAKAEVSVSEATIESSKANIANAEAEIKSAAADVVKNRVQMEEAKRQMDRAKALYEHEAISRESLDTAVANYDTAVANYDSSKAKLTAAHTKKDAAAAQLNTAESQLKYAKASLWESEANLSYNRAKYADTIIKSPLSGIVVFKSLEKGEMATPGTTILTIVDLNNLYVRVDIEETLIGNITLNGEAIIRTEGAPDRTFKGKVSEIGSYAEFATQRDVLRGRQDIKTFRVKITVDDPTGFLKPGMTVEVAIFLTRSYNTKELKLKNRIGERR
ncbi:MAG: efflux RND transporter periplasmic adaptor subunit [Candidatus Brocadia sp.]|jgi:multidrug resistance efflux pump